MAPQVARELLLPYFTALGVVLGGAWIGALATALTHGSPLNTLRELAEGLRLWAIVAALGGTFQVIRMIESGLFSGELLSLLRQVTTIVSAFLGASTGYWAVRTLVGRG